jgi:hypothetical protein
MMLICFLLYNIFSDKAHYGGNLLMIQKLRSIIKHSAVILTLSLILNTSLQNIPGIEAYSEVVCCQESPDLNSTNCIH